MATWELHEVLGSPSAAVPMKSFIVGTGGVVKGQPVVFGTSGDANKVINKTGGADTVPILGVAAGTVAAGGRVSVILGLPNVVFRVPIQSTDTPVKGTKYGISTAFEIDDDNTTQVMVRVVDDIYDGKDTLSTTHKACIVANGVYSG